MALQQISPGSIAANPTYVNPKVRADQSIATPQINQDAQKAVQAIKTDTVTISQQALQKLAGDGNSAARETRDNSAANSAETLMGKQ